MLQALESARENNDSIKDEIWHELAQVQYGRWQHDSEAQLLKEEQLQQRMQYVLDEQHRREQQVSLLRHDRVACKAVTSRSCSRHLYLCGVESLRQAIALAPELQSRQLLLLCCHAWCNYSISCRCKVCHTIFSMKSCSSYHAWPAASMCEMQHSNCHAGKYASQRFRRTQQVCTATWPPVSQDPCRRVCSFPAAHACCLHCVAAFCAMHNQAPASTETIVQIQGLCYVKQPLQSDHSWLTSWKCGVTASTQAV